MVTLAGWLCAGAGSVCFCCTSAWGEAPAKPGGSFLIPAYAYDRGVDIVTCTAATSSYVDAEPMVGNLRYPSQVEYDIEFPVSGEYRLAHPLRGAHGPPAGSLAGWQGTRSGLPHAHRRLEYQPGQLGTDVPVEHHERQAHAEAVSGRVLSARGRAPVRVRVAAAGGLEAAPARRTPTARAPVFGQTK